MARGNHDLTKRTYAARVARWARCHRLPKVGPQRAADQTGTPYSCHAGPPLRAIGISVVNSSGTRLLSFLSLCSELPPPSCPD